MRGRPEDQDKGNNWGSKELDVGVGGGLEESCSLPGEPRGGRRYRLSRGRRGDPWIPSPVGRGDTGLRKDYGPQ